MLQFKTQQEVQRRSARRSLFGIAAAVVGFCGICGYELFQARISTWERAADSAGSLVAAIEADLMRNIESIDVSLRGVLENYPYPGLEAMEPELRQLVLFDRSASVRGLGAILVLDEDGNTKFDSRSADLKAQNLSDRSYFWTHRDNANAGLFISEPMLARSTEQWFVGISRRISKKDGSFGGVAVASLRLSFFQELFQRLHLDGRSNVTLALMDGTILVRWPNAAPYVGMNIKNAEIYKHLQKSRTGYFETNSVTDGERRLVAYSQVGDFPLVIGIGQATSSIYKNWKENAYVIAMGIVALLLISVCQSLYLNSEFEKRQRAEEELASLAMTDGLTGLSNHRHFNLVLEREWARSVRAGESLSLLMVDTDKFKEYNDRNGHLAGDALLKAISFAIRENISRSTDCGARYGGDEFSVLLPNTPLRGAIVLAESIRRDFLAFYQKGKIESSSLSIGIACLTPAFGDESRRLVQAADAALYKAKELGRNRIHVFEEKIREKAA